MGMKGELQPDFVIGNMTTDLVDLTLQMCRTEEEKTPRFPKRFYSSYVDEIVKYALDIQRCVCQANSIQMSKYRRIDFQEIAIGDCVCLEKLVLIALNKGWISEKQFTKWQKLICNLHWKIHNWMKA